MIKAALNGGRTRAEHPNIPITPEELAGSAREAIAAGAACIHFHVRGPDGKESLTSEHVERSLKAIRKAIPEPVGVSTGAWILRNTALRYQLVSQWTTLPDFASVNFNEDGAVALADLLLSRDVPIEAGLSDLSGTKVFVNSGLASRCLRLLIEPMQPSVSQVLKTLDEILAHQSAGRHSKDRARAPVGEGDATVVLGDEEAVFDRAQREVDEFGAVQQSGIQFAEDAGLPFEASGQPTAGE